MPYIELHIPDKETEEQRKARRQVIDEINKKKPSIETLREIQKIIAK